MTLIIANWKMYFTLQESYDICKKLEGVESDNNIIIAPSTAYLAYLTNQFPDIDFAAQDVSSYENFGSYTGENSAKILKSCNVEYTIIGHAERKTLFNEGEKVIQQKIRNTFNAGLIPIICIGEDLQTRENNACIEYITDQLSNILIEDKKFILAYEPIWSIGTGNNPANTELAQVFDTIKNYLSKANIVNKVQLIYGGSVTPQNIRQILDIDNIDGVLIGGAALSYDNFKQIIQIK